MRPFIRSGIGRAGLLCLAFVSGDAAASGFALIENSVSSMGAAYAGAASSAEDAATIFFNPAGMVYLGGSQAAVAVHALIGSGAFHDGGSIGAAGMPPGGEGSERRGTGLLPAVYYAAQIRPDLYAGVSVNAPFGIDTEYDSDWIGRFHALKTELDSVNVNPALAWKVNDALAVGAGVSAMRVDAELTHAVNFGLAEGTGSLRGSGWGYGYNVGAIVQLAPGQRIGLAYRSKVREALEGDITFVRPPGLPPALTASAHDSRGSSVLMLPDSFSLSGNGRLSARWEWLADVTWTRWSRFGGLRIDRDDGTLLSDTPLHWRNTFRYSLGAGYRYSEAWKLRAGVAYDESTTDGGSSNANLPDNDRKWLTLGASYRWSDRLRLDFAAAHFFLKDTPVDDDQRAGGNGYLKGYYSGALDILSVQAAYGF